MDTLLSTTKLTNRELITWGYGVKMNLIFNHILMIQRGGLGNGTDPAYQTPVQAVIRIGLLTCCQNVKRWLIHLTMKSLLTSFEEKRLLPEQTLAAAFLPYTVFFAKPAVVFTSLAGSWMDLCGKWVRFDGSYGWNPCVWPPKGGMNSYFYDCWYDHKHNPSVPSEKRVSRKSGVS